MLYDDIFRQLQAAKIKYVVVGGIAVNLHGYARTTGDLDLLISFEEKNVRKFVDLIRSLGLRPTVPVQLDDFADPEKRQSWITEKGMKVFSIFNPKKEFEHIDIMVENYIDFKKAFRRRRRVSDRGVTISVMAIPDLIKLKQIAGRDRDKIDIGALKEIEAMQHAKKKSKARIRIR